MKKTILSLTAIMAAFVFMSCNTSADQGENQSGDNQNPNPEEIIPPSKGENPFENKVIYSTESKITFDSDGTCMMESGDTVKSKKNTIKSEFFYSWNTESKELYIQLSKVFINENAKTYSSELEKAHDYIDQIKTATDTALNTTFTAFNAISSTAAVAGIDVNAVEGAIQWKFNDEINFENAKLEKYLEKQYKTALTFKYEISEETITLKQKVPTSLSNGGAWYKSDNISLNDYYNFKPFYISTNVDETFTRYVGVPVFDETNKTFSVQLGEYYGNVFSNSDSTAQAENYIQYTTQKYTSCLNSAFDTSDMPDTQELQVLKAISDEAKASPDGRSATLENLIDELLEKINLIVTYSYTADDTLKFGFNNSANSTELLQKIGLTADSEFELEFKPILSKTEFTIQE